MFNISPRLITPLANKLSSMANPWQVVLLHTWNKAGNNFADIPDLTCVDNRAGRSETASVKKRRRAPDPLGARGRKRFYRRAEAFACFLGGATFAAGTITLCTGITLGCPGSIPSC